MSVEYGVRFQGGCVGVSWVLAMARTVPKMSPTLPTDVVNRLARGFSLGDGFVTICPVREP